MADGRAGGWRRKSTLRGSRPWWVDPEQPSRGRALLYARWYFWGNVAVVYVNEAGAVERVSVRSSS